MNLHIFICNLYLVFHVLQFVILIYFQEVALAVVVTVTKVAGIRELEVEDTAILLEETGEVGRQILVLTMETVMGVEP